MSLWSRIANVFRPEGDLNRDIDEELDSHIEEAVDQGRDPAEARRALGPAMRARETSRDIRILGWLDSLRSDAVFGWRQLMKNKVASAAAVLSLALAVGSCTSAFRIIDALLFRTLPVVHPEQLYALSRFGVGFNGKPSSFDGWAHPAFTRMRQAVKGQADLIAISNGERYDLTFASDNEIEKAQIQYVSGWMFESFGLRAAAGRVLTENDDRIPGASPYAVLSHDYWTRRFGADPQVVGRTFHLGDRVCEIVGVVDGAFTGTEPGSFTDIFLPATTHPFAARDDSTWHSTFVRLHPGVDPESVRAQLHAISHAFEEQRIAVNKPPKWILDILLNQTVRLEPSPRGASDLQREYRGGLVALGVLVTLVLLIACANVANLMTAQAAARTREMALRVSIGAGRSRLIQLVLVEGAWISLLAALGAGLFAVWSAPFVVDRLNPPDNPAQLFLPWDWRVFTFSLALTLVVTLLFALTPALRASSIQPVSALKGADNLGSRRRLMHALIAAQVAFCFVVLYVSGMLGASFERLSKRPMGFSSNGLLVIEVVAAHPRPPVFWNQVVDHLRTVPGVEAAGLSAWPLLAGGAENSTVSIEGTPPDPVLAFFLPVAPGWTGAMKLPLLDGRDFRPNEASPGVAIVNETFVKQFFKGENPIGRTFKRGTVAYQVIGLAVDAPYRSLREAILPVAYVPFQVNSQGVVQPLSRGTFIVRTLGANPLVLAPLLRQEIQGSAYPDLRVANIRTQQEINQSQSVRERLLAALAMFFAGVALLLAGIGLYGVLDYSVLQRRREIGIRIAIGAPAANIARVVSFEIFAFILLGSVAGLALGSLSVRYIQSLLFGVKATDVGMLLIPAVAIAAVSILAALWPVIHALRIDPVKMLRAE